MIRFSITLQQLHQKINAVKPNWLQDAADQTAEIAAGTADPEFPGFWSDIKEVYIKLQGSKCAFCEKWLEDEKIEHDVEHFRPKSKVVRWPLPAEFAGTGMVIQQPANGSEPGYKLLAYDVFNYAASCKTCNSILKKNYFPIAGVRESTATNPANLGGELAYLIYPIGSIDTNPETLIEFYGLNPRAKIPAGFDRHRALVTIKLFRLDHWRKGKELNKDRAEFIEKLFWALRQRDNPGSSAVEVSRANDAIARVTSRRFRHANCLRSFQRLYESDPNEAERIYELTRTYLKKYSSRRGRRL